VRLGDVVFEATAAGEPGSTAWQRLAAACGGDLDRLPERASRMSLLALDAALPSGLPSALAVLARRVAVLESEAARRALLAAGFESGSLWWGALAPAQGSARYVFWRPDPLPDERVFLPLYPVVAHHARCGEAVVHAAAIAGRCRAVLLLGPSGAGKSTAAVNAGLAGAQVLSDDGAVLACGLAGARVVLPLPGVAATRPSAVPPPPVRPPLAGLCFLEKADGDRLRPLSKTEALSRLVSSCLQEVPAAPLLSRVERIRVFETLGEVVREVPCFVLALRARPHFYPLLTGELCLDG
jgi:hypothetical protein